MLDCGAGGGAAEVCDALDFGGVLGALDDELGFEGLLEDGVEAVEETSGEPVAVGAVTAPELAELGDSPAVLDVAGPVATLVPEPFWVTA